MSYSISIEKNFTFKALFFYVIMEHYLEFCIERV